jgi:hypothetical protein
LVKGKNQRFQNRKSLIEVVSRRKVAQNPDSSPKQCKGFSEKKDFGSLKANFEVFNAMKINPHGPSRPSTIQVDGKTLVRGCIVT